MFGATRLGSSAGTSDLTFVDETMAEIRRNWNVTTQDDVRTESTCTGTITNSFLVQSHYGGVGNAAEEQSSTRVCILRDPSAEARCGHGDYRQQYNAHDISVFNGL